MIFSSIKTRLPLGNLLLYGLLPGLTVGCGSSGMPDMVQVRGQVLYNGGPLTEGTVVYIPQNSKVGRQANGAIQEDGTFELTTVKKGDGVKKGEYLIAIYAYKPHPGEPGRTPGGDSTSGVPKREFTIPDKYASTLTSGLTDVVDDEHPGYREFSLSD